MSEKKDSAVVGTNPDPPDVDVGTLVPNGSQEPSAAPARVAVRCAPAWASWLASFASHLAVDVGELVDSAVTRLAKSLDYPHEPPARTVKRRAAIVPPSEFDREPTPKEQAAQAIEREAAAGNAWAVKLLAKGVAEELRGEPALGGQGGPAEAFRVAEGSFAAYVRTLKGTWLSVVHCPQCKKQLHVGADVLTGSLRVTVTDPDGLEEVGFDVDVDRKNWPQYRSERT